MKPALKSGRDEHYPTAIGDQPDSAHNSFEMRVLQSDINRLYNATRADDP